MAHFTYPVGTPLGTVPSFHVLTSIDWQSTIQQVYKAINGDDGGTWAPGAFITIGGSGLQLTGTGHSLAASARLNVESTGEIRVKGGGIATIQSGGTLTVDVGGTIALSGTMTTDALSTIFVRGAIRLDDAGPGVFIAENTTTSTWQSGATATFNSGSTVNMNTVMSARSNVIWRSSANGGPGGAVFETDSTLTGDSGSTATWNGTWTFGNSTWPALSPARSWERHSMDLAVTTFGDGDTTGPASPDAWLEPSNISTSPCIRTSSATASVADPYSIVEFKDLPAGGVITQVEVTCKGEGTTPTQLPRYLIVRWQTGDVNLSSMSLLTTDAHTTGNFTSISDTTTVAVNALSTIDKSYRYGVKVFHPYSAVGTYMRVFDVVATGTVATLKV